MPAEVRCILGDHQVPMHAACEKVTGFEKPRRGGGANQIVLRQPMGQWACWECIEKAKRGIATEQSSFAGEGWR